MSNSLWPHTVHEILHSRIREWVAVPFSKGSFWPRDQTQVSCITGRFFTVWATREAHWSLGPEEPLEKGMATRSSILAWKIPWTEKPGRLQSMESPRVGRDYDWTTNTTFLLFKAWKGQILLNPKVFTEYYYILSIVWDREGKKINMYRTTPCIRQGRWRMASALKDHIP